MTQNGHQFWLAWGVGRASATGDATSGLDWVFWRRTCVPRTLLSAAGPHSCTRYGNTV